MIIIILLSCWNSLGPAHLAWDQFNTCSLAFHIAQSFSPGQTWISWDLLPIVDFLGFSDRVASTEFYNSLRSSYVLTTIIECFTSRTRMLLNFDSLMIIDISATSSLSLSSIVFFTSTYFCNSWLSFSCFFIVSWSALCVSLSCWVSFVIRSNSFANDSSWVSFRSLNSCSGFIAYFF
jgi:hypothetical protein